MKKLICGCAALAVLISGLVSAAAAAETSPVHFRGMLSLGDARHFSLATDGGAKTKWVGIGDSFNGYEVVDYDSAENILVLKKDGEEMRLGLAGGSADEGGQDAGTALDDAAELFQSIKFEEMMAKSLESQKEMMERMFRQMADQGGPGMTEEALAAQMRFIEAFHKELDWNGMQEDMIQAYAETFTREELRGLVDFYSTPAGQGFINKQGDLMQRTTELMQPRIMAAMGKLMPMIQEMQQAQQRQHQEDAGKK